MVRHCDKTLELFSAPTPGRPRTSSAEKRRRDNARRQAKYRARQRVIKRVVAMIAEQSPLNMTAIQFLQYLHHPAETAPFERATVCVEGEVQILSPAEIERAMLDGIGVEFN